jgi:hypothetical protein
MEKLTPVCVLSIFQERAVAAYTVADAKSAIRANPFKNVVLLYIS